MSTKRTFMCHVGDHEYVVETGHLAGQAGGAVTMREGDTTLFATATMSRNIREGIDFFPLSVDFEERLYAAGRIPGSWFRREGRPPVSAILIARMTDRPLRPLFNKNMRNEVQVILYAFAHDGEHQHDVIAMNAASAALHISDIPWAGPIGAVRVGLINDEFVINPTYSQMAETKLDLRLAGTADAINMVECQSEEVDEATMIAALKAGHEAMQPIIALQEQMRAELGKEKQEVKLPSVDEELRASVTARIDDQITSIVANYFNRDERNAELDDLREEVVDEYTSESEEEVLADRRRAVKGFFSDIITDKIRSQILEKGVRPDGRDYTTIRPLTADTGLIPRAHGTGIFHRGETQVLSFLTLGTLGDAQEFDGLEPADKKYYLHHYNFPPFSTGETWFMRGPKRREIGHGQLAENALLPVLPAQDDFPYTIRVVSEVMSSNGSTSMASVCASTLALMDGGVPIKKPVGGIAMGLISDGERHAVLTDIQGMEDHIGDMDFKVAGTRDGITALQMDIKIKGLPYEVLEQALHQAKDARLEILDVIEAAIPAPREELSPYAPRMTVIQINPEKIRTVIGKGGETVRGIQSETNSQVHIEEDGTIYIAAVNQTDSDRARSMIEALTEEVQVGRIYTGTVRRVENFGAFVEILPGTDGLVHVSQLETYRVDTPHDVVSVGDEIMVMVTDVSNDGKVRLSRQAVLEGWTLEEAQEADQPRKKSGGNRGGNRDDRGGNSGSRSGDRGRSRSRD